MNRTFENIISAIPLGTHCSVVSVLAATLYQWNHDRKFKVQAPDISYLLRKIYHIHVYSYCCKVATKNEKFTLRMSRQSLWYKSHFSENKLIFNEMIMRSALNKTNTLSLVFIVLTHWYNSPLIDLSPHSDTLSGFRVNQSLLFLHNAVCLVEKQQTPILQFLVWSDRGSNPRSTALEASTLTITPSMRLTEV